MLKSKVKKLSLNKETVRALSGAEMTAVAGGLMSGGSHGCSCSCNATFCTCETGVCPKKYGGALALR